jgi:hypothetical protein
MPSVKAPWQLSRQHTKTGNIMVWMTDKDLEQAAQDLAPGLRQDVGTVVDQASPKAGCR